MNKRDENMEWEKEASYLASLPRTTPYRVPDQYFENLQSQIQQAIFLDGLVKTDDAGFTVPTGYFAELREEIESKIVVEKLKSKIGEAGFQVPSNYFETLQSNILSKTAENASKPKIIKLWHTELVKYVSAACFILLAASMLYINQQQNLKEVRTTEIAHEQMLYDIDESVIIEHLQESQVTTANTTSATEIENYILDNFSSSDLSNNL